jgi:hypothetical protein
MSNIKFGDFPETCQICWKPHTRFGTLVDRVGRMWLICQDCIQSLWDERQAVNMEESERERQTEAVDAALGKIRDMLLGNGELWNSTA